MKYDVFISYSHRDNLLPVGKTDGWISRFHFALEYYLTAFLGRSPSIFRDNKMKGYERLTPSVFEALDDSQLFIPVLSPNFLTSEWCPKELGYFYDKVMTKSETCQVFPVLKLPIDKAPDKLKDHLLKFEYYKKESLDEDSLVLFYPDLGAELENKFNLKTSDLARSIAAYIKTVPSKSEPVAPPPVDGSCIYLAEPSPDLWECYEDIKRDLEQRKHSFLPSELIKDALKPPQADLYKQAIREDIGKCRLTVNLVGGRANGYPKASASTYQQLQMEVAAEKDGEPNYKRLIWLPKDIGSDDEEQLRFIEGIRNSPAKGVEFLQGSLEEFKTSIQDALKPAAVEPSLRDDEDPPFVYVLYDQSDLEPSRRVEDLLLEGNCEILPARDYLEPALRGDRDVNVYEEHQEWLKRCDAVLIYWNLAPSTWVRNNIYDLQKAKAIRNGKKFRAKAIFCDGEAESERKNSFRSPIVEKVKGIAELPLFLSRLEVQFQ